MSYGYKKLLFEMLYFICLAHCKTKEQEEVLNGLQRKFDAMFSLGDL